MKKKFAIMLLCVITSICFLAACKKQQVVVQFEGTYTTSNEILNPPPMLTQKITGIGNSNRLNLNKFVAISTINLSTPPPFRFEGTSTSFAADGDVFYTTFTGSSTPNEDGTSTVVMTHNITGGTGKFEHASGSIVGNSIVTSTKPTNTIITKGTIKY